MHTEEEAKAKWCVQSVHDQGNNARCVASACMAWRGVEWYRADTNKMESRGYCGLAGNPTKD